VQREQRAERADPTLEELRAAWEAECVERVERAETRAREEEREALRAAADKERERNRRKMEKEARRDQAAAEQTRALTEELARRHEEAIRAQIAELSGRLGEIALELASRVVRWVVERDSEVVGRTLAECLDEVEPGASEITVRLNPRDAAHLRAEGVTRVGARALCFVEDAEIERGGCMVEDGGTTLDARIGRQLDRLGEALALALQDDSETDEAAPKAAAVGSEQIADDPGGAS